MTADDARRAKADRRRLLSLVTPDDAKSCTIEIPWIRDSDGTIGLDMKFISSLPEWQRMRIEDWMELTPAFDWRERNVNGAIKHWWALKDPASTQGRAYVVMCEVA